MKETKMTLLGFYQGKSKKTGKDFYMVYFYAKSEIGIGYQPYSFFIDYKDLQFFKAEDILKEFIVSHVFAGGQNIFISCKKS